VLSIYNFGHGPEGGRESSEKDAKSGATNVSELERCLSEPDRMEK
jgi:hypothetical protein